FNRLNSRLNLMNETTQVINGRPSTAYNMFSSNTWRYTKSNFDYFSYGSMFGIGRTLATDITPGKVTFSSWKEAVSRNFKSFRLIPQLPGAADLAKVPGAQPTAAFTVGNWL